MPNEKPLTLAEQLKSDGWNALTCVPNNQLPECLTEIALGLARGEYKDMMIVPTGILFNNREVKPTEEMHVVYIKSTEQNKERGIVVINVLDKTSGDVRLYSL